MYRISSFNYSLGDAWFIVEGSLDGGQWHELNEYGVPDKYNDGEWYTSLDHALAALKTFKQRTLPLSIKSRIVYSEM